MKMRYAIRQHHGSAQIGCKKTFSKISRLPIILGLSTEKTLGQVANPGGERSYGDYSKMAAVLCGFLADSLPAKTVSEHFIA